MAEYPGRVLGIDYGARKVGVAVSDPLRVIARGVGTLDNDATLTGRLRSIIEEEQAVLIVIGMPYAPDGGKGAQAQEVDRFIALLRQAVTLPIETWDESYSSGEARTVFIAGGMKRRQRREKRRVDEMAARVLLQEYLAGNSGDRQSKTARP